MQVRLKRERKQKLIGKSVSEHYLLAPVINHDSSDSDISLQRQDEEKFSVQSLTSSEESFQGLEKDTSAETSKTQKESNMNECPSQSIGSDPSRSICFGLEPDKPPDPPRKVRRVGLERHALLGPHLDIDVSATYQVGSEQQVTTRQFQQRLNELITIIQPNKKGWNYDKFLERIDKYLTASENKYQEMRIGLMETQNISLTPLKVQTSCESLRRVPNSAAAGPSARRQININDYPNANNQHYHVATNQINVPQNAAMGSSERSPFTMDCREIDLPLYTQYEYWRRLYRCNICGKDFRKFWNRHKHFLSVHKISKTHLPLYFPSIHEPKDGDD